MKEESGRPGGLSSQATEPVPVSALRASIPDADCLPCPFCGGEPIADDLGDPADDSFIHCSGCEVQQIANYTPQEAAARWNTRVRIAPSPIALPEYGDWLPNVWHAYLRDLVGWEGVDRWAILPATFRWHDFHGRLAQAIEARRAETAKTGSVEDESAVGEADAPTLTPESPHAQS